MDQGGAQRRRRVHGTPTPNGRRSSFRDWAAEATDHPREVVEAAYRRSDLFERRRKLMVDEVNPIRPTKFEDPKAGPFG